jgi:energy-coupling factor transporter ATP-binding protein EcfA2
MARMVISKRSCVNLYVYVLPSLADRRLIFVTGKGGSGKTTIAAALALLSAREGKRTLVCEVNAKERISHLLGRAEVGADVTCVEENLWAVNVQPHQAMREYALMVLRFESIYNAVFENRFVRYFLRFLPSMQELVLLGKILFHLREKRPDGAWRFDRVVVDGPATGHALTFLSVPQVLLDTVPPGQMATEAIWMRDLLIDGQVTAAVLVSLPEELPVNETLELHAAMASRLKIHPQLVVLNEAVLPRFSEADVESLSTPELRQVARAHLGRELLTHDAAVRLMRLGLPLVQVPRLYSVDFGRRAIEEIATALTGAVGRGPFDLPQRAPPAEAMP